MPSSPDRPRRVSVALQTDKTFEQYAALSVAAEQSGFDGVSVFADLGFQSPAPALTVIAEHTTEVRIGVACHSPAWTHPVDIAAQTAASALFSGGRTYCGLARGAWLEGLGVAPGNGLRRLAESVTVVRALLAGDDRGVAGSEVPLPRGFRLQCPLPETVPPLLIGTWGRRTAALAGDLGVEEVKIGGSANPAMVALMRSWLPDEVGLVVGAVTVCDVDGAAARDLARREVALYLDVVAGLDPTLEVAPAVREGLRERLAAGDTAGAAALVEDDLLDAFCFSGTPEMIAAQAEECFAAGADRVEFGTPHGLDPLVGIALLGDDVLPRVRP